MGIDDVGSISDLDGIIDYHLTPTISTPSAARAVQAVAAKRGVQLGYHLKIDTGMNRLGFRHDNLRRTLPELLASNNLRLDAVYTHLCRTMTRIGEPGAQLFLARFALLAIDRIGDAAVSQQLIDQAGKGLPETPVAGGQ